jgi:SAM-dependent methyltransferase
MEFDPEAFQVSGWLWLERRHPEIAAVEVWSGEHVLGTTRTLAERGDVSARYELPGGLATAFAVQASAPRTGKGATLEIRIHARLRNHTLTEPLFVSRIGPLPPTRDPRAMLPKLLRPGALGLEIGAHHRPTPGVTPFYTDSAASFAGTSGRLDFLADASALPLADGTLDYLCSSHVLEHLANPLAALWEWHRALAPGGLLYLVVPDKRFTFDAPRATTGTGHLLLDFARAATAGTSREHVDEFVSRSDWSLLHPEVRAGDRPAQQARARAAYLSRLARGESIDIHFHTFTPDSLRRTLTAAGLIQGPRAAFTVVAQAERYPPERTDGIALLLRRQTPLRRPPPAPTCCLASASAGKLPLVDPRSLEPLPPDHLRRFSNGPPDFLPAPGTQPRRPWSPLWRRHLLWLRGCLRLLRAGTPA